MSRPLGLSRQTLPVHPQRQPDELLSSWILALARANGCKVHTLCSRIAGNQHTVWNRDIDRMAPPELLARLAELTLIDAQTIRTYSLAHVAELIDVDHHARGNATWMLPLGVWHRKRRAHGVQFCTLCLRMDCRPYIRRSWRLAYYTECERHSVLLMDRCPSCGNGFSYFRGELGHRSRVEPDHISVCTTCGLDLAYATPERFEWPDWSLTVAVRTLQLMNDFGWATLDNRTFTPAAELLLVVRQLIRVMSSPRRAGQLYDTIAQVLWPEGCPVLSQRGRHFERRSIEERHRLFGMALWLLMDWPQRFESAFAASGIHRSCLRSEMTHCPDWYSEQCAR